MSDAATHGLAVPLDRATTAEIGAQDGDIHCPVSHAEHTSVSAEQLRDARESKDTIPTAAELDALRAHSASALARAADLARLVAIRAKAGEPVMRVSLRLLLAAAAKLAKAGRLLTAKCSNCQRGKPFRRGACRSCHRKLSGAGIPLPPKLQGRDPRKGLRTWAKNLHPEARAAVRDALRDTEPT